MTFAGRVITPQHRGRAAAGLAVTRPTYQEYARGLHVAERSEHTESTYRRYVRKEPPMTWVEHHHRDQALRTVIELADRRRDGLLPWDEIADAVAAFGTPADLLAAMQMRWYTRLSGSIETVLGDQPGDLEQ